MKKAKVQTVKEHTGPLNIDVVIIGAGPAGMAAAISLRNQGIEDILLVEREGYLGGILPQCIHDGFGLIRLDQNLTGPEYAALYEKRLGERHIAYRLDSAVTAIKQIPGGNGTLNKVTVASKTGPTEYMAKAVILATGCRERPRGALKIQGTRPAGIYTAGTAQNFINLRNLMPGKRFVILGSGDIGLILARRLILEGGEVMAVIEKEKTPGGLPRNVRQCLVDFNVPLILGATITGISGRDRIEAVTVCDLDSLGNIVDASAREYICDTLILSVGLIPEIEAGLTTGITVDEQTGEPLTDTEGQTTSRGIFVCGNARYVHDLVDDVTTEAEELGMVVAHYIREGSALLEMSGLSTRTTWSSGSSKPLKRMRSQEPNEIICLLCPNSCLISYDIKDSGQSEIKGAMCGKGEDYVLRELISPLRTLTSSVKVLGGSSEIVSVRTTSGIPRDQISNAMERIKSLEIKAPVEVGQIIEKDFMTFEVDLVATSKVL